jgi:alpha-L-fucosidase 2
MGGGNLKKTEGGNPNPYYDVPGVPQPVIAKQATPAAPSLKPSFVYDLATKQGVLYKFRRLDSPGR